MTPSPSAYLARKAAQAAAKANQWEDAAARYAKLRLMPGVRASDVVRHARAVESQGSLDAALIVHDENVSLFPLSANVRRQRALALLNRGDEDRARLELAQARVLVSDDKAQEAILTVELERLGVTERDVAAVALNGFHSAPAPAPATPGRLTRYRAQRIARGARDLRQAGDWVGAAVLHEKVLALTPHNGAIHIRQGHALKAQARFAEAELSYWRGVALTSREPDGYLQLGHALKLGKGKEIALPAYLVAFAIEPGFQDLENVLGDYGLWEPRVSTLAHQIANAQPGEIVGPSGILAALSSPTHAPEGSRSELGGDRHKGSPHHPVPRQHPAPRHIDLRAAAIVGDIGRAVGAFV